MLGAIVVHNWQVARRAIALGLVFPSARVCVCVCPGHQVQLISFIRRCALTFPPSAERQQQPRICGRTLAHVHMRPADIQRRREPRGIASQGRKCRLEQESVGGDRFYTSVWRDTSTSAVTYTHLEASGEHNLPIQNSYTE